MQTVADRIRKKLDGMGDSFDLMNQEAAGEDALQTGDQETNRKTQHLTESTGLFGHWKYTGPKDTIENPWMPTDPEKKLSRNIDLVDDRKKLKQLDEAIKICSKKLVDSNPNKPWMYTGPKDTVENMVHVDHVREWVPKKYSPAKEESDDDDFEPDEQDQEKKLLAEKKREEKRKHPSVPKFNVKEKSEMYEKDYSQIKKYPWKIKYEDYMDESAQESDDSSLHKKRQIGGGKKKQGVDKKKKKQKNSDDSDDNASDDEFNLGDKPKAKDKKRAKNKKKKAPSSDVTPDDTIEAEDDLGF